LTDRQGTTKFCAHMPTAGEILERRGELLRRASKQGKA
jgi:hypothetical protein